MVFAKQLFIELSIEPIILLVPVASDFDGVFVNRGTIQNALQGKVLSMSFGVCTGFDAAVSSL